LEQPGDCIGDYQLLERIGEGGCGVVYVAEQLQPVRRRVALKIIKAGMDRQVAARFEVERQAQAMMDHPNIAKVLDAGSTAGGRSYFVMELVLGPRLTEYCDDARLPPRSGSRCFFRFAWPCSMRIKRASSTGI
jgi:serine/threonine protein kinase